MVNKYARMAEKEFIRLTLEYLELLNNTPWYKFKKRYNLKKNIKRLRKLIMGYGLI